MPTAPVALVLGDLGGQVDVGEDVAVEHEEAVVEQVLGVLAARPRCRAARAPRRTAAAAPNCEPSPSTLRDARRQEAARHDHVVDAVAGAATRACRRGTAGRRAGATGLGTVTVSGRSRVPSPADEDHRLHGRPLTPARCPRRPGPAARTAAGSRALRPSMRTLPRHRRGDLPEVELLELLPLGDEHDGVGVADAAERVVGELDARHQLARLAPRRSGRRR